jgi:transcriptional/translational regulatory protein YebC/TACO1
MNTSVNREKLTKLELIDSINMHYFKKGILCENLNKMSKFKLLEIYIDNNIEYVNKEQLKTEILATEKYNHLRDIIHCNFIKYENIPYDIIANIKSDTTNEELEKIIEKYNLKYEESFINLKELVFNLYKSYKKYCDKSSIKNECIYITLPNIIKVFKEI